MYKVVVLNGDVFHPLHVPGSEEYLLIDPVLTMEMGMAGSFSCRVPPDHPHKDKIHPLISEIHIYQNGEKIFRGRYVGSEEDFNRIGKLRCEGDLAYLLDSIQRPFEHQGSILQFLEKMLAGHNSQVEERKRFRLGNVTVVDGNNDINRSSTGYNNTLSCLREKLVDTHGGYFRVREANGVRYLDYLYDYGGINSQAIGFGENLLDLSRYMDTSTIITALIPVGASIEEAQTDGTMGSRRVDITSVNGGQDFIYIQEAVDKYGWIMGVQEWNDVTLPENLLKKAQAYLEECVSLPQTLELKAVDLSLIRDDISRLKVGYWTHVASAPHGITGTYLLSKRTIHLTAPEKDTVVLGGSMPSMTGNSAKSKMDLSLKVQQIGERTSREIEEKVENASRLITGGLGGYVVIGRSTDDGRPEEILIMDAPTKEAATNLIRINKNGIGFSNDGYCGDYRNAWTIDGNLVANFITAGTMLADRIRGGTLEVGGSGIGIDGEIVIKDENDNMLCILDKNGIEVFRGKIQGSEIIGSNLTLGGQGNVSGILKLLDASGNTAAMMDDNGLEILKGKISGSTVELGGINNASGSMTVKNQTGDAVCSMDKDGLYAIRGSVGGWEITDDLLASRSGMIASYAGEGTNDRATMNDASFKIWREEEERCYLGLGNYNGWGSADSGLLYVGGQSDILLDGNSGKVNARGDIQAYGNIRTTAGDLISDNGNVVAKNIDDMLARIEALEAAVRP